MTKAAENDHLNDVESLTRAAFEASVAGLDAATLSKLNQSRQRALVAAAGVRSRPNLRWWAWAPAGALAAVALAAVLLLRAPAEPDVNGGPVVVDAAAEQALDPLVLMAAGDDLELATEADLDFYAWVDLETADGAG
jgi:hypothetical protein